MLNAQDYFDKHLRRLAIEWTELWSRRWITVPLSKPELRCWSRSHVLPDHIADRADQDALRAFLPLLATSWYSKTPEFREFRGRGRRRRFIEVPQALREIPVFEWERRNFPEQWLMYFHLETRRHYRIWRDVLIFRKPSIFPLKIEPVFATTTSILDAEVDERLKEIETWLWHRNARPRFDRLAGFSGPHDPWSKVHRQRLLDRVARRELWKDLHHWPEVEFRASMWRAGVSLRQQVRPCWTFQHSYTIYSPVAQFAERPTLDREVDGANPSGAALLFPNHRFDSKALSSTLAAIMRQWMLLFVFLAQFVTALGQAKVETLSAEQAKAALVELIRKDPKAFPGNINPDELARRPLVQKEENSYALGGIRLELAKNTYWLVVGTNGLASAIVEGKFTLKDGVWSAGLPTPRKHSPTKQ